jgi:hypothetical protein
MMSWDQIIAQWVLKSKSEIIIRVFAVVVPARINPKGSVKNKW